MTLAVEFRPKDIPPLSFGDDCVKMFVSGAIKSFDDAKTSPAHSLVTTKRHFFYNRLANSVRVVNRFSMKFADYEAAAPIEQVVTPNFESTSVVLLLRDGSVVVLNAQDMPDKSVKIAAASLAKVANATALCVLQNQGTTHSAATTWANKQVLVFAGSAPVLVTRLVPSHDGSGVESQESLTAGKWASTFGKVTSCSAGPNGFVAVCGSASGSVQVLHEADLSAGSLQRTLSPHNEVGAQSAVFIPRDSVTSDADPTLASSAGGNNTVLLTAARGGHELRLWGLRGGGQISLLQTVAFADDKDNGDRAVTVDPSGDMVLVASLRKQGGTVVACEPDADRTAFRRITEWALPEGVPAVSCAACPNKDAAQRFYLFARTEKSLSRYTFDNRIVGAANVSGSSSAAAAAASSDAAAYVDPAIVSASSSSSNKAAAAEASNNKNKGGASASSAAPKDVHAAVKAAVSEASAAHFQVAARLAEASDHMLSGVEHNIGTVLGVLRIPGVRQKSHEIAADWAQKVKRAIDEASKQANARIGGGGGGGSSSSNGGNVASGVAGFTPALAQTFYTSFLENIHGASQTVVDHSLDNLLETAISKALDRSWTHVADLLEKNASTGPNASAVPKPTALPSFRHFSEAIVSNQTQQNQMVKRQVEQNRRDLDMYDKVDGSGVAAAERYLQQVQTAMHELGTAVVAAKSAPSAAAAAAGAAVTPANEQEVFEKIIKLAKEGQWKSATTQVANGGSISLLTRFFDAPQVEPFWETICTPANMAASSFVHCLKLLSRGVVSAPAVALSARVGLIKRIAVAYSLALAEAEEAGSKEFQAEEQFLRGAAVDIEEVRADLKRVNGPDRNTTRFATLAFRALGSMIGSE